MADVLWTGDISFIKKIILNINGIIAWISGNMKNTEKMKDEIKAAYNGDRTSDVKNYDAYGWDHYSKVTDMLLEDLEIQGKLVLDLGCGSGISTLKLLERNAGKVCAVDISEYMVGALKKKIEASGYPSNVVDLGAADAEKLPFDDSVFDVVISSMALGMVPNQIKMIREMARVLKPRGIIAVSTHGLLITLNYQTRYLLQFQNDICSVVEFCTGQEGSIECRSFSRLPDYVTYR